MDTGLRRSTRADLDPLELLGVRHWVAREWACGRAQRLRLRSDHAAPCLSPSDSRTGGQEAVVRRRLMSVPL
ncbi:hypothetical protein BKH22_07240 [Actinomyces oris]|nr:hypothetical protein BKH22_07240 [Actinomyces oris]